MTSIPLIVKTSEWKQFRCIYLKNKTFFLNFFRSFQICIKFQILSEKNDPHSLYISKITDHEIRA